MSKFVSRSTADRAAVGQTLAVDVSDLENCTMTVTGIGTATVVVQYSNDGTEFVGAAAALTANGKVDLPRMCKAVRLDVTAWTSGTIKGRIGGVDTNRVR